MSLIMGPGATDRSTYANHDETMIDYSVPANESGNADIAEFYFKTGSSATGVKIGTFYGTGANLASRDYETIGNVTSGSKQTFTGLSITTVTGDLLGMYSAAGTGGIEAGSGTGMYYMAGDQFGTGSQTYTAYSYLISIYATGPVTYQCSCADGLSAGSTLSASMVASASLTANLQSSDSNSESMQAAMTLLANINLTDIADGILAYYIALTENVALGDFAVALCQANPSLSVNISLAEALATALQASLNLTDGVMASDIASVTSLINATLQDGIALTDLPALTNAISALASANLNLSGNAAIAFYFALIMLLLSRATTTVKLTSRATLTVKMKEMQD